MEAIFNEINNGKYDLKAIWIEVFEKFDPDDGDLSTPFTYNSQTNKYSFYDYSKRGQLPVVTDWLIIPADRSEMIRFALRCFHYNIPFCHSRSLCGNYD